MIPILSIVIANYNYGRFLETAIRSICAQIGEGKNKVRRGEVELIIIDGGSTDNSVEIIKKYANGLPSGVRGEDPFALITYWVTEKDRGQSEAFNKGFVRAKGEFLTWLNADDIYLPGALYAVIGALKRHPKCDWATANFLRFTEEDKKVIQAEWGPHYLPFWMQGRRFPLMVFGPTTFWRRSVYEAIGPIDENLHFGMDTEYWWRLTVWGCKQVRVNHCCWAFRMHTESKTAEYGSHENSMKVKQLKLSEHDYTIKKHRVAVSTWARVVVGIWRIFDFSYAVRIWRKFFIVGTVIKV